MIYGLYHSAAGMMVDEYRQSVLANNLANADTAGFKPDLAIFAERQTADQGGDRSGPSRPDLASLSGGLWLGKTYTDFTPGVAVRTDNPLDVALTGEGFLSVSQDGERVFTRDGRMIRRNDGAIVAASDGAPVLGRGGTPLQTNPLGGEPRIDEQGRVWQDDALVGELELTSFDDLTKLRKVGDTRFAAPENTGSAAHPTVRAGYVETSGVKPVSELVNMVEAARTYQMNAQMVSLQDQTISRLLSVLTR